MRFDDRLLTVLNQPAGDRHDIAVRWRQLVDLVARAGSNGASPAVADALDAIRADAPEVDESLRAAAARAVAALPLPLNLLEHFASDRLTVSAPVLAAATLDQTQWQAILNVADEETRRFIETLHPQVGSALASESAERLVEPTTPASSGPSLHELVERIERRRRARPGIRAGRQNAAPEDSPSLFRWECGPGGEIAWVDGVPRGALIGRSIARPQNGGGDRLDSEVVRAFMLRAPFRDATLTLAGEGLLAGEWKISGVPAFEPADGRFAGYRGIALREEADASEIAREAELLSDPDSLRELVHEIKTPLNAIIGFAEIIEGQYLGPADRRYRERAEEIVRQARLLLTAIDDLDFAAKIHSSPTGGRPVARLGELVEQATPALRKLAADRGIEIDGAGILGDSSAAIEPELAERLIVRMCTATIEQARPGERLRLTLEQAGGQCRVSITRPSGLSDLSEQQGTEGEKDFDCCFSFRLVRGLARIAGAELVTTDAAISLLFARA